MPYYPPSTGGGAVSSVSNSDGTLTVSPTTGVVVASIANSTALPGSPTTTTQSAGDNSTKIATDAFVTTAVNNAISGVNPAIAVQVATTSSSDTSGLTYNNGVSGVGATFTGSNNTALTFDGQTLTSVNQRVLVKNDTQSPSGAFNGVYFLTQIQTAILPPILTRALDYDQPSDINNTGAIPVILGTVNAQTSWVQTAQIVTVGTTPLSFTQFTLNPTTLMTTNTYDPAAIAQQLVGTTASQTLTNKTLTSPTLTTPTLGAATATSINGLAITSSTGTLTITNGKTLSVTNTLTLSGTDSTTMTFPTTSATIARTDAGNTFTGNQTISGTTTSADTTILQVSGTQTGARTQFFLTNLAAATTTARASFALQTQTSVGTRTTFQFDSSFSTTTDATRTSTVLFNVASSGSFGVVMQFVGQAIGVFGAAAVAQQGATGNATVTTAGSTNTVFRNTTFTGGSGSTAYTIGDIVLAMKNFGWLAT